MDLEIVISPATEKILREREKAGCVSCGYILTDWKGNGHLTDLPGNFPVEAKIVHIESEKAK
jgi:hypothetical protein